MAKTKHSMAEVVVILFVGLSLALVVTLTIPHNVRANPGVLYAVPTVQGSGDCSSWADACPIYRFDP